MSNNNITSPTTSSFMSIQYPTITNVKRVDDVTITVPLLLLLSRAKHLLTLCLIPATPLGSQVATPDKVNYFSEIGSIHAKHGEQLVFYIY